MRLHRFYVGPDLELSHDFWVHNEGLVHQWKNVLRMQPGQELTLFDGVEHERLYKIVEIKDNGAHLIHVTDFERKLPKREIYLLWALLKKDKNDWVLQKGTELGVSHFIPLLADRSEKTGFNVERARKIIIEAAEQCGRSDIPNVRGPMNVKTALEESKDKVELYICEQDGSDVTPSGNSAGILVGPEGGWSDNEKEFFQKNNLKHLNLHDFTLRAETAAVAAVTKLIQ
jgi:16S rRNA (uracil1498-N3)-methyltransferase